MLAQDSHGGIWVALKTGALARLRLAHWSAPAEWFIQDLGVGALPFYVQVRHWCQPLLAVTGGFWRLLADTASRCTAATL